MKIFHRTLIGKRFFYLFLPAILLFVLIILFSLRLLSDPDLGFHLNAGQWILTQHAIPYTDISTYSVSHHEYIDIHWLFQTLIYSVFLFSGYQGLSILVSILVLLLFFLLYLRLQNAGISPSIVLPLLLLSAIMMEFRFILRPELFTFLFLVLIPLILDLHQQHKKRLLWILPIIFLIWCNMQGLFILGYAVLGCYFLGSWIQNKKPDLLLLAWSILSGLICLANPYGIRGVIFPFELLTRFGSGNVFHEHITEFQTLFTLTKWTLKEYAFLGYFMITLLVMILTRKNRKLIEWLLMSIFSIISLTAIRNIPLFILITLPITSAALKDISIQLSGQPQKIILTLVKKSVPLCCIILSLLLIPRLLTNAYYQDNLSYNRTGIGLDTYRQPEAAAAFLVKNHCSERILNNLGFGGWLSWRIPQPIFIDARLEVIDEALYKEVMQSWHNGLPNLISKYKPRLIIYDYIRYYPWTPQLLALTNWQPIYLDGLSVIWADTTIDHVPPFRLNFPDSIASSSPPYYSDKEIRRILNTPAPTAFRRWLEGFYQPIDCKAVNYQNIASFLLQTTDTPLTEYAFLKALDMSKGALSDIHFALTGLFQEEGKDSLAALCFKQILKSNPEKKRLLITEAVIYFNQGNEKYQNRDIQGALKAYAMAIQVNPLYTKAYINRGLILASELHDFQSALKDFESAINIDPSCGDAYLGRGSSRFALQDKKKAMQDWEKAAALGNHQARELVKKFTGETP